MDKKIVFVSGCFDVIHGGHIEFLTHAKGLGNWLVVCVPTDRVIEHYKHRRPALFIDHRLHILKSLSVVDEVVIGDDMSPGINFRSEFIRLKPTFLAVTEDDKFEKEKRALCSETGAQYIKLPKTLAYAKTSSTQVRSYIKAPDQVPLRVDFGGGWLDVPKFSRRDACIVNCTIKPMVSLAQWSYKMGSGLGGSAAYKILLGEDSLNHELDAGVGWQDPAIIQETGLCAWQSGPKAELITKTTGSWLKGHMAIWWTGKDHNTVEIVDRKRNYDMIEEAGNWCREAVQADYESLSWKSLWNGVRLSYRAQLEEGMKVLPDVKNAAKKYCGSGWGGYALYLFTNPTSRDIFTSQTEGALAVEPYLRPIV